MQASYYHVYLDPVDSYSPSEIAAFLQTNMGSDGSMMYDLNTILKKGSYRRNSWISYISCRCECCRHDNKNSGFSLRAWSLITCTKYPSDNVQLTKKKRLFQVYVNPHDRRQGIGELLAKEAMEKFGRKNLIALDWDTRSGRFYRAVNMRAYEV